MPSLPAKHTGILREENIALRQILGYRLNTLHPVPPYSPPPISHCLPGTSIKDVLLVAVDVDTGGGYEVISPGQSFHMGISILDTRHLLASPLPDPRAAGNNEPLFCALDAIAHAPVALPVWVDRPKVATAKLATTKLGVKAKGRLKKARRDAGRISRELPYHEASDRDGCAP